ncbi:MAG: hypothetical protein V9G12_21400 [Microthrixaceae bacterium]
MRISSRRCRSRADRGRELRLSAGAAQVQDQPLGDLAGDLVVMVGGHHREGEVHAGGDAGGRPGLAVAGVDEVTLHVDLGVLRCEPVRRRPVGRGPLPVEEPGRRQDEGAGTDRPDASGDLGDASEAGQELGVDARRTAALAAGDQERVGRVGQQFVEAPGRSEFDAAGSAPGARRSWRPRCRSPGARRCAARCRRR